MMQRLWLALGFLLLSCGGTQRHAGARRLPTSTVTARCTNTARPVPRAARRVVSPNVDCDFSPTLRQPRPLPRHVSRRPGRVINPDAGLVSQPDLSPAVRRRSSPAPISPASVPPDLTSPPDLFTPRRRRARAQGACPDLLKEPNNVYTQATPTVDNIKLTDPGVVPRQRRRTGTKSSAPAKGKARRLPHQWPPAAPRLRIRHLRQRRHDHASASSASTAPRLAPPNRRIPARRNPIIRVQPISTPGQKPLHPRPSPTAKPRPPTHASNSAPLGPEVTPPLRKLV